MLVPALFILIACGSESASLPTEPGASSPTGEPTPGLTMRIQPEQLDLEVGEETQLEAVFTGQTGEQVDDLPTSWTSSDPGIAEVTEDGLVRALAEGDARITATSPSPIGDQPLAASASVSAKPKKVATVTIQPADPSVTVGDTLRLEAIPQNDGGEALDRPVKWSSEDESVATVAKDGLVRGVSPGSTTITASAGGAEGAVTLTVSEEEVAGIQVRPDPASVEEGESLALSAEVLSEDGDTLERPVKWVVMDGSVARIDEGGMLTGLRPGSTRVKASSGGVSRMTDVDVLPAEAASVTVTPGSAEIDFGSTVQLEATVEDADGTVLDRGVAWSSSDESVVTVDASGLVTGEGSGSAEVVAAVESVADTVRIDVESGNQPPVATIDSPRTGATFGSNDTVAFEGSGEDPEDGTLVGGSLEWSSDVDGRLGTGESVSTVLTAATHTISLTATDAEGVTATARITVTVEEEQDTTDSSTSPAPPSGEHTGPGRYEPSGAVHVWDLDTSRADQDPHNPDQPAAFVGSRWTHPETNPDYGAFFGVSSAQVGEVMELRWKDGAGDGRAALWTIRDFHTDPLDVMYVRLVFRFSDDWQPHSSGTTKLINWEGAGPAGNFTFNVNDQTDTGGGLALHNIGDDEATIWETEDVTLIRRGTWYDLELVIHRESAVGADDGRIDVFLNGTEVTGWNALGGAPSGLQERLDQVTWFSGSRPGWDTQKIGPYWGGCCDTKQLRAGGHDAIQFGEIYVSGVPVQ